MRVNIQYFNKNTQSEKMEIGTIIPIFAPRMNRTTVKGFSNLYFTTKLSGLLFILEFYSLCKLIHIYNYN